ncbi:tyrosine-type recombinase/integrase [Micromonospora sp. NPDC049274]|uniref:tyrosine-type recombinase/integrase n=1 Tax=Micromonospora sp. NPDC049274 TaxID=3154829 RepID=UPI00342F5CB2
MGFVRKTPAGRQRACWRDPAGKQKSKTFRTKKEANAFLAEVESALNRGTYVAPDAGRLHFAEYAEKWLANRNDEKATAARDASIMRNHVIPRWGTVPLAKVEHSAVQGWITSLGERLSPATVRECYRLTSGVLRTAVRDRLIGFNACEGVRLPPRRRLDTDDQVISRPELFSKLLPVVPDRYRALVAFAAGTGLRWGECAGLRWDAVDLDAAVVRVVRVAEEVSGYVNLKPYPKSRAGRRTVPLPPFVVQALIEHRRTVEPGADGLIFVTRTGEAVRRGTFRARVWKPSLQRAGLPMGLRFHDLRHSYATWLVSDGVPINDVAKVMGHEQTSTTLNRYTHSTGERDRRVLASFAAFSLPPDQH